MSLTFSEAQGQQMRELQRELTAVLLKANDQRVDAAIAVFALVRCMRPLMDLHNPAARGTLLDLIIAFLAHAEMAETPGGKLLVM